MNVGEIVSYLLAAIGGGLGKLVFDGWKTRHESKTQVKQAQIEAGSVQINARVKLEEMYSDRLQRLLDDMEARTVHQDEVNAQLRSEIEQLRLRHAEQVAELQEELQQERLARAKLEERVAYLTSELAQHQ